jgi:hypothetical protein
MPRRRGAGRLRQVAQLISPAAVEARSGLEVDFLALCREAGLPEPAVNATVEGHMVDFLWPAGRVIVETDSYGFHGDRLAFERDRRRSALLIAAGYDIHRTSYEMLQDDADLILGNVRRSLQARCESRNRAHSTES